MVNPLVFSLLGFILTPHCVTGGDVSSFIDTGSYVFNALLSGSINGGLPANKITAIAIAK